MGDNQALRDRVREHYAAAARTLGNRADKAAAEQSCCQGSEAKDPITRDLYADSEANQVPAAALQMSLGCGNPTALIDLEPGQVVLDLGSGGGIDVLLSARRVGPTGKAYGLDMTDEMLERARENQRRSGLDNVEFLKGTMEEIPLPDASVDVVISNCVINLSTDKDLVLKEAFRVLKPQGRFAVSDVVLRKRLPDSVLRSVAAWSGCIAGALQETDYKQRLQAAGFSDVSIEPTRVYSRNEFEEMLAAGCCGNESAPLHLSDDELDAADQSIASAFVRATKPSGAGAE